MTMNDANQSHQKTPSTQPPTFSSDDEKWEKRVVYTDGVLMRSVGIPSQHAHEVPDTAQKHYVWLRNQGVDAISLFKQDKSEKWFVHVANGARDYVSDVFDDITAAKKHISKLRETGDY